MTRNCAVLAACGLGETQNLVDAHAKGSGSIRGGSRRRLCDWWRQDCFGQRLALRLQWCSCRTPLFVDLGGAQGSRVVEGLMKASIRGRSSHHRARAMISHGGGMVVRSGYTRA